MNTQKKSGARRGEAERASEGQFGAAVGLLLGELLKTGARVTAFVSVAVAKFLPGSIATLATVLAASLPTAAPAQPVSDYFNYTRTSAFSYDSNGLLVSETVEPDLQQVQCLTTTYTYDGWGNKNSATTASCLPSAAFEYFDPRRTLSLSNGAPAVNALAIPAGSAMTVSVNGVVVTVPAGTFMRQTLNALSHSEVRDIDPRFGVPVKLTGPNALDTSWTLDGFGRVVLEIRADGTRIKTNYCYFSITEISANSVDCPAIFLTVTGAEVPALAVYGVQTQQFDASGTAQGAYSRVYHDRVGRKLRTVTQAFDGTRSLVQDNDYNEFGAVVISTSHTSWTAVALW